MPTFGGILATSANRRKTPQLNLTFRLPHVLILLVIVIHPIDPNVRVYRIKRARDRGNVRLSVKLHFDTVGIVVAACCCADHDLLGIP